MKRVYECTYSFECFLAFVKIMIVPFPNCYSVPQKLLFRSVSIKYKLGTRVYIYTCSRWQYRAYLCLVYATCACNGEYIKRGRWWAVWKERRWRGQAEGRKRRVTLDMGYVTRWKLGPEEAIYHIHTPATSRRAANERTGGWTDGRTDRKEERERQWQSSYVDRDISSNFVSRIRRVRSWTWRISAIFPARRFPFNNRHAKSRLFVCRSMTAFYIH